MSNEDAARQLAPRPNLIFLPRAAALRLDSLLGQRHATIIPIGRDGPFRQGARLLNRPTGDQLVQALKTMGLSEQRALQIGRNCGHSATVLARLIPSGSPGALVGRHKKAQHPSAPLRAGVQRRDKQRKKDPFRSAEGLRVGRRAERNKETAYIPLWIFNSPPFSAEFPKVTSPLLKGSPARIPKVPLSKRLAPTCRRPSHSLWKPTVRVERRFCARRVARTEQC